MKLIFNTVLVCHLIENSISHMMYGDMGYPQQFIENQIQQNFDIFQSYGENHHKQHHHQLNGGRHRCTCKIGQTTHYNNFHAQYPPTFPPDVIVVPYPVPVMVIPNEPLGLPVPPLHLAIPPIETSPTEPTILTAPSTSPTKYVPPFTYTEETTTMTTSTTTLTTSTVAPTDPNNELIRKKRFGNRFKIMGIKTRRKEKNYAVEPKFRAFPRYGIVRIPDDLAIKLLNKFEDERVYRLLDESKQRFRY